MAYEELQKNLLQRGTALPAPLLQQAEGTGDIYAAQQLDAAKAWLELMKGQNMGRRNLMVRGFKRGAREQSRNRKYGVLGALLGAGGGIAASQMGPEPDWNQVMANTGGNQYGFA